MTATTVIAEPQHAPAPTQSAPLAPADMQAARRRLLALTAAWLGLSALPARSAISPWLPYAERDVAQIEPTITQSADLIRIDPQITRDFELSGSAKARWLRLTSQATASVSPQPSQQFPRLADQPPRAYVRTGERFGVAPWLLYGVALQESQVKFGQRALPYPWTLCVSGTAERFSDYASTLLALKRHLGSTTNVDCGAMQVNWRWHSDKLGSFERALDPYPNLAVGAQILRGHFDSRRDWRQAIALYHTGTDDTTERRLRGARYAASALARLTRLGVDVPALLQGGRSA